MIGWQADFVAVWQADKLHVNLIHSLYITSIFQFNFISPFLYFI